MNNERRAAIVLRAWIFLLSIAAWILALGLAVAGRFAWATTAVALALLSHIAGRIWSRVSPIPLPYWGRAVLRVPRGPQSPQRLNSLLRPLSGERILEVGPGIGVHALPVAAALVPDGVLDVLDVQQDMLDDLMRRAAARGLTNIVSQLGDAQALPYADRTFDAAYAISVLGEVPDQRAALRELHRVLKPGGRLAICEVLIDPDFVALPALRAMADDAGLQFERHTGPRFAYNALFRRS